MVDLPAPFGPQEAEDLAPPNLEVEIEQPVPGPVVLGQPCGADRRCLQGQKYRPRWKNPVAAASGVIDTSGDNGRNTL